VADPDYSAEDNLMFQASYVYFIVGGNKINVYSQTEWGTMAGFDPPPGSATEWVTDFKMTFCAAHCVGDINTAKL